MKITEIAQGMTTTKNIVLSLAVIIISAFALYWIFKKKDDDENGENADPSDDVKRPTADGSTVSNIYLAECKQIAGIQYDAMNRAGTDEKALFDSLKGLNGKALQMVYKYFGKPKYAGWGRSGYIGEDRNLFGWYRKELGSSDLDKMRDVWKKSGLKFP